MKELYGNKIFVDSNAFIYFFLEQCNSLTFEIFKQAEKGNITLITTTRVVDEVCYKSMIISAKKRFNISSKPIEKLKKDKNRIKALAEDIKKVLEYIYAVSRVVEITSHDLKSLPDIMKRYGVFGNDALVISVMQSSGIKHLLSADKDFDNIGFIKRLSAL